jgi:hypothetical protein
MEKYIKDGKVAVVIAPSFGGGWASWNHEIQETLALHPAIVQMVLDGRREEVDEDWLVAHFGEEFRYGYYGANDDLTIKWLPVGTKFCITEYDGAESILTIDDLTLEA